MVDVALDQRVGEPPVRPETGRRLEQLPEPVVREPRGAGRSDDPRNRRQHIPVAVELPGRELVGVAGANAEESALTTRRVELLRPAPEARAQPGRRQGAGHHHERTSLLRVRRLLLPFLVALALAGCGSKSATPTTTTTAAPPDPASALGGQTLYHGG